MPTMRAVQVAKAGGPSLYRRVRLAPRAVLLHRLRDMRSPLDRHRSLPSIFACYFPGARSAPEQ